jgi:pyruvate dehydrogenase (quinone)
VLGAGVAKALNGRAALPDTLPFVTGPIGLLGSKPSDHMMGECDTLLMVGTSFPLLRVAARARPGAWLQIDIDGRLLGMRYPTEVNLVGDAGETLRALAPLLVRKEDRAWREEIEEQVRGWWELLDRQAHVSADPLNPELLFHELSPRLPDGCILTADSGSATNWWRATCACAEGMLAALSGTLATMCPAVPYALAAKFAHPTGR